MTYLTADLLDLWSREFEKERGFSLSYLDFRALERPSFVFDVSFQGGSAHQLPLLSEGVVGEVTVTLWITTHAPPYQSTGEGRPLDLFVQQALPFFRERYGVRTESLVCHRVSGEPEEAPQASLWRRFDFILREPFILAAGIHGK